MQFSPNWVIRGRKHAKSSLNLSCLCHIRAGGLSARSRYEEVPASVGPLAYVPSTRHSRSNMRWAPSLVAQYWASLPIRRSPRWQYTSRALSPAALRYVWNNKTTTTKPDGQGHGNRAESSSVFLPFILNPRSFQARRRRSRVVPQRLKTRITGGQTSLLPILVPLELGSVTEIA